MKGLVFEKKGEGVIAEFNCDRYSWRWERVGKYSVLKSKGKLPSIRQLKRLIKLLEEVEL